jgi:hypothetical protein
MKVAEVPDTPLGVMLYDEDVRNVVSVPKSYQLAANFSVDSIWTIYHAESGGVQVKYTADPVLSL